MRHTLVIMGTHPGTRDLFDFKRDDCDVWLFNEMRSRKDLQAIFPRADAVFQMHVPAIFRNPGNRNDPGHYEWLRTQTESVIYMAEKYDDVPMAERYPLEGVLEMLGGDPNHFLTSTCAEMIALAILLGYPRVEVYGVAMESNTEYTMQRDGVAFWYGFAKGRGVDFIFNDDTYRSPVYGVEGSIDLPYKRFEDRILELSPKITDASDRYKTGLHALKAAVDALEAHSSKDVENALYDAVAKQKVLADELGLADGAMQENVKYKQKADTMIAATGSFLFSRQEFETATKKLSIAAEDEHVKFISIGTQLEMIQRTLISSGGRKRAQVADMLRNAMLGYLQTANKEAVYKGAAIENAQLLMELDRNIRAAGGEKAEAVLRERIGESVNA